MVQNKDIDEETIVNGEKKETLNATKLNGVSHEMNEHSEDEDDYLQYLLVVPSLDRNVSNRNMSLISDSLSSFYTAIESRKEYPKIKQELMGNYVPDECMEVDSPEIKLEEPIVNEIKVEVDIKIEVEQQENQNEVNDEETIETKNFSLQLYKARLG